MSRIGKRDGGQWRAFAAEASAPFLREMHRVAHRAAVAAGQRFVAPAERPGESAREGVDLRKIFGIAHECREALLRFPEGCQYRFIHGFYAENICTQCYLFFWWITMKRN